MSEYRAHTAITRRNYKANAKVSNPADSEVPKTETGRNPEALEKPESGGISTTDLLDLWPLDLFMDDLDFPGCISSRAVTQLFQQYDPDYQNKLREYIKRGLGEGTVMQAEEVIHHPSEPHDRFDDTNV